MKLTTTTHGTTTRSTSSHYRYGVTNTTTNLTTTTLTTTLTTTTRDTQDEKVVNRLVNQLYTLAPHHPYVVRRKALDTGFDACANRVTSQDMA